MLSGIKQVRDVPYTGPRGIDAVGAVFSVFGMGGIVLGILVWQEGGEAVGALLVIGAASLSALAYWLVAAPATGASSRCSIRICSSRSRSGSASPSR